MQICKRNFKKSYSQSGEDIIIRRVLRRMHVQRPKYLDIGAHHPIKLNNTYLLYKDGGTGVLIEPNPFLIKALKRKRKRDIILPYGVGTEKIEKVAFYIMSNDYLSTFSKQEADKIANEGRDYIKKEIKVSLITVEEIIQTYLQECPNFVSLDVEGLDYEILKEWDFTNCKPEVFCVETLSYTQTNTEEKRQEIFLLMQQAGYIAYADTYINAIFVNEKKWRAR